MSRKFVWIECCRFVRGVLFLSALLSMAGSCVAVARADAEKNAIHERSYWAEQVIDGLNYPSAIAWLPSGDALIAEFSGVGRLRILRGGRLLANAIEGTPKGYVGMHGGIRDIAIDPDFQNSNFIYLLLPEGTLRERYACVYRARYANGRLEDVVRIFRSHDAVSGMVTVASRLMFIGDGTLLFAVSEDRAQPKAQQFGSHLGKILRINKDGSVPADNPFVDVAGARPEIWTYGHRVPLGFYQERDTGTLWEVESGPRGGDELNVLHAGKNYGWGKASWGFAYANNGLAAPLQTAPDVENPVLVWTPSVTPSGLVRYRGKRYPSWKGDYFVGHLTGRAIERLQVANNRIVLQERLLLELDERIRDVKVGPDDYLYVLTDGENGRLIRLRAGKPRPEQMSRVAVKARRPILRMPLSEEHIASLEPADLAQGRQAFLERCAGCHAIATTVQGVPIGPDLSHVYGRLMGEKVGYDYSPSMRAALFFWRFDELDKFLADPEGFVPGTKMTAGPVLDPVVRRNIIGFLRQESQL